MKILALKRTLTVLALALSLGMSVGVVGVSAQSTEDPLVGLDTVGTTSGLGSEDPTIIVANIIRAGLGILGVIAIVILMYGGFLWMTAGGSEDKVTRAKKLIINAGIGVAIILASLGITQFVLEALIDATSGDGNGTVIDDGGGPGLGGGSNTVFAVTKHQPTGQVSIRNVVPQITFSKTLDPETVTNKSITFTYTEGNIEIPGTLSVSGNRVSFVPATPCPDPNKDRFCFNEQAEIKIAITTDIKSSTGTSLSCTNKLCDSSFITGSLVDVEDPTVEVELPDDGAGVSSDSWVDVQASATDDAQVAVADFAASDLVFDSVPAAGADLTDVLIETVWDTTGLANGSSYRLTATVFDIAGNTDSDSVTVRMRPATCFNDVIDGIETGLNCGGDSSSADYCGACDGSSCNSGDECSSGMCREGICVSLPVIQEVSPPDGAPGTWVALHGRHFGTTPGSVSFSGPNGLVKAELANCVESWTNSQILVVVPEGAIDGPIEIQTSSGAVETTYDDNGELIADFDVNQVLHPGLCALNPKQGSINDAVSLSGQGFGAERKTSTVSFNDVEAGSYTGWTDVSAGVTVPPLPDGNYFVAVNVDGISSNMLKYRVTSNISQSPSILEVSPANGGEGQYITISGTNFGTGTGTVWFEDIQSQERVLADTESFPAACSEDYWSDQEITVIVPKDLGDLGDYNLIVVANGQESNNAVFTLTAAAPTPGLCNIEPPNDLPGSDVTLHGDNFGSDQGTVVFSSAVLANVQSWSESEIVVSVPNGALTGAVVVNNDQGSPSNPVNFEVSDNGQESETGRQAAYAWSFSSGFIPDAPEMIFECSDTLVSGVPNNSFDNGPGVCVNAAIFAAFTLPMNEATLNQGSVEECTAGGNDPCAQTSPIPGVYTTTSMSVRFDPANNLRPGTTYKVTTTAGMLSSEGAPLGNAGSWTFTTREDNTACSLEKVIVTPYEASIRELNGLQDFAALPVSGCMVLQNNNYNWSWSVNQSYARFDTTSNPDCSAGNSTCALVQGLAEGTTPVVARETRSGMNSAASLTIDFTDPYVTNSWPDCTEACVNAEVGASFNTAMSAASLQAAGAVRLYRCANELCSSLFPVAGTQVNCVYDDSQSCVGFKFADLNLAPATFYRAIISGNVTSTSGVALTRTNYAGNYSWIFRVREDASVCAVDRISVSPRSVIVSQVGEHQAFSGEAFGEADSCSVSGQRLSGFAYSWDWANPIEDQDLDNNPATRVAEWQGGVLVDTQISQVAIGCTASCTAAGSMPVAAVCGDGRIDFGEECEDGNVADNDGCSASCLREGNPTATCGNKIVNRLPSGVGEDCDDGNLIDGDGCSSLCLAEGSSSVLATCGNGDIAVISSTTLAGEECDDGNAVRGDGCSNECLHEGSPTLTEIGGAVCGDGNLETPAEQCDDGNTKNGDGCSSSCLWEGSTTTCGVKGIEYGEACDDGNTVSGDGCSRNCLLEGSSTLYSSPSFCGDGLAGVGELAMCELGVTGDGNIDPIQVAFVPDSAVLEVDPDTQKALGTIQVTEVSSGLTTEASLSLLCSAESDSQCVNPATYGVGANNCCMLRPEVTLFPVGSGLCRNSALYAVFDQEMNLDDFEYQDSENGVSANKYRMYARLDVSSTATGVCPAGHTTLAAEPRNLALRLWNKLVRLTLGRNAEAAKGDCVVPIATFTQTAVGDGTYKVKLHPTALLEANATYTLVVEGDDNLLDVRVDGVTTKYGVGINGTRTQDFNVGDQICALENVSVLDTDVDSRYVFTRGQEQHLFTAEAMSYLGGIPQEIASIEGVYSWEWSSWRSETEGEIVSADQVGATPDMAEVTAVGENGDDVVFATATIRDNVTNLPSEEAVTGSAPVLAFLCENPWPGDFSQLPWSDTADGDIGAEEGSGWMNFSTMYCKDQGQQGFADDLPEVVVVRPPVTESANVIKEYLYEVAGSSDAIGIRVVSNPNYLSPEAWYESQGFTGNLSQSEVGGYKAGKDGRTTYVVATNQAENGDIYANVYVISYNAGANDETIDIYNQILDNFTFAVNVDTAKTCSGDEVACASPASRLSRDMRRLTDITDLRTLVTDYRNLNGAVPTLPSGTFVRALSSSVWESWNSILGGALEAGNLPTDPINAYVACGGKELEAYDAETCVNELLGTYVCPADSRAYHYKSIGESEAVLYADLEYTTGTWANPIEVVTTDGLTIRIGNSASTANGFESGAFCEGTSIHGSSTTCGDGVVGGSEVCELGQYGGSAVECKLEAGLLGTRSQVCNASCTGFVEDAAAVCVVASCGNGVVEFDAGEDCDDGSLNGTYGFCGNDCSRTTAFFCGDGKLAGGESCDCGATAAMSYATSRAYGSGPGSCSGNVNGVYADSPNNSCAWNCAGPASHCGDGTVDSGEVCDGTDAVWDGKLCMYTAPAAYRYQPCVSDSDCGGGRCGGNGAGGLFDACEVGKTRVKTCDDAPGASCTYFINNWVNVPCNEIGSCGDGVVDPGEACDDGNTDGTDSCTDQCTVNVCGDGYVHVGAEQCDEGANNGAGCDSAYGSSCTACSLSCRYEVTSGEYCGDGQINGNEFCDASSVPYIYYNADEDKTFASCTVLNDRFRNPADGLQYTCTRLGVCNGGESNGAYCTNSAYCGSGECIMPVCGQSCANSCPFTYASTPLQMTTNQPGARASEVADFYSYNSSSTSDLPNAATLTVPACNVATSLSASISLDNVDLPTTYVVFVTDLSRTMRNAFDGAEPNEADERSRLEIAKSAIPSAAEQLFDKFGDNVRIGAIGYRGLVQGQCFYDPEQPCIAGEYASCPEGETCDSMCTNITGDYCNDNSSSLDLPNRIPYGEVFDFIGPESENELATHVASYTYDPFGPWQAGHGTFTYEALVQTKRMFDSIRNSPAGDNARYITILLSDGEYNVNTESADGTPTQNPILIAQDFDSYVPGTAGYELYSATIAVGSGPDQDRWIKNMKNWSSNSYDGQAGTFAEILPGTPRESSAFNGLDYAYQAATEDDLEGIYDSIVDSIVQITVTIVADDGESVLETSGQVEEGDNVLLPWPENFVCNDLYPQQVPIQISFPGSGMVQVSNVRLNYCAP